jgi:hypothetical protein
VDDTDGEVVIRNKGAGALAQRGNLGRVMAAECHRSTANAQMGVWVVDLSGTMRELGCEGNVWTDGTIAKYRGTGSTGRARVE